MHNKMSNAGTPAKSFKDAIKRLFKELEGYRKLVVLAIILAVLGSILSILAPNRLSKLTDEISKGLVVNQENLTAITSEIGQNITEDKILAIMNPVLNEEVMTKILVNPNISTEDKEWFQEFIQKEEKSSSDFLGLPQSILNEIFTTTSYNEVTISKEDKLALVKIFNGEEATLSNDVLNVLVPSIEIQGVTISSEDQLAFLSLFHDVDENTSASALYQKMDGLPESIHSLVEPFMDIDKIKSVALLLLGMYICSAIFTYIQAVCMTNVANKFARDLRGRISRKINVLPLKTRIRMMNKKRTNGMGRVKYLLMIPAAALLAAACQNKESKGNEMEEVTVVGYAGGDSAAQKDVVAVENPVGTSTEKAAGETPLGEVYDMVEQAPSFPGGPSELMAYLSKNIKYPKEAQAAKKEGRVIVQFVVASTGEVTNVKVMRGVDPLLDAEAIRVVEGMPRWTPGRQDGEAVNVRYTLPVTFRLS